MSAIQVLPRTGAIYRTSRITHHESTSLQLPSLRVVVVIGITKFTLTHVSICRLNLQAAQLHRLAGMPCSVMQTEGDMPDLHNAINTWHLRATAKL
jgi:hypothetical protein